MDTYQVAVMMRMPPGFAGSTRGSNALFKALADPTRRRMLTLLAEGELPLNRIEEQFKMSRPAVIKHMRVLRSCRLVTVRKEGRETIHRLNSVPLMAVRDWILKFECFWDDRLQRLKRQIEEEI